MSSTGASPPETTGPLRLSEALVIALAIVVVGGVFIWVRHRERLAWIQEQAPAIPALVDAAHEESTPEVRAQGLEAAGAGDPGRATALLGEVLRRDPLDTEARLQLARCLLEAGQKELARAHLTILARLDRAPHAARARALLEEIAGER